MSSVSEVGPRTARSGLETFERYLTLWVALCNSVADRRRLRLPAGNVEQMCREIQLTPPRGP